MQTEGTTCAKRQEPGSQQMAGVNKEVGGAGRRRSPLAWGVQTRI